MSDLVAKFFESNFTEDDWGELERVLQSSPGEAERLANLAERDYLKTGLPVPHWPGGKPLGPGGGSGGATGAGPWIVFSTVLLLGVGTAVWHWLAPRRPMLSAGPSLAAPVDSVPKPTAVPSAKMLFKTGGPVSLGAHDFPPPPMAVPRKAGEDTAEAGQLAVVVELEEAEPVTVKVLGPSGELERTLFTGRLNPGKWSIDWDGLMPDGKPALSGRYRIQVQAGPNLLAKEVEIASGQSKEIR